MNKQELKQMALGAILGAPLLIIVILILSGFGHG